MSTIKERIEREQSNIDKIYLYKEGIFYKAYERSAYLWITNICNYEIKKRYVKTVDRMIVYIGFPISALENRLLNRVYREESEYTIVEPDTASVIDAEAYNEWHKALENEKEKCGFPECNEPNAEAIVDEIMKYPIETSSPIECMMFLSQLKKRCVADGSIYKSSGV
ncbi:MAG: hypothetical protein IJ328_06235 [Muribaculaceae bacterium]|nr:hypothetical protein [Muribaculaceae bacterium]